MPKPKREYSKIIVAVIIVFAALYMIQNAVVLWLRDEYDSSVAVSLAICLSICVATYNWRAQAADTYRFQRQWLEAYIRIKSEHPDIDLSDFQLLTLPDNISHN